METVSETGTAAAASAIGEVPHNTAARGEVAFSRSFWEKTGAALAAKGDSRRRLRRGGFGPWAVLAVGTVLAFALAVCFRGLERRGVGVVVHRRMLSGASSDSSQQEKQACQQGTEEEGEEPPLTESGQEAEREAKTEEAEEGGKEEAPSSSPSGPLPEAAQQEALLRIFRQQRAGMPLFREQRRSPPARQSPSAAQTLPAASDPSLLTKEDLLKKLLHAEARERGLRGLVRALTNVVEEQRRKQAEAELVAKSFEIVLRIMLPYLPEPGAPDPVGMGLNRERVLRFVDNTLRAVAAERAPLVVSSEQVVETKRSFESEEEEPATPPKKKKKREGEVLSEVRERPSVEASQQKAEVPEAGEEPSTSQSSSGNERFSALRSLLLQRMQREQEEPKSQEEQPSTSGAVAAPSAFAPHPPELAHPNPVRADSIMYSKLSRSWTNLLWKARDPNFGFVVHLNQALWDLRMALSDVVPRPHHLPYAVRLTRLAAAMRILQSLYTLRGVGYQDMIDEHVASMPTVRESLMGLPPFSDPWRAAAHLELGRQILEIVCRLPGSLVEGRRFSYVSKSHKVETRTEAILAMIRYAKPLNWRFYVTELPGESAWMSNVFPQGFFQLQQGSRQRRRRRRAGAEEEAQAEEGDDEGAQEESPEGPPPQPLWNFDTAEAYQMYFGGNADPSSLRQARAAPLLYNPPLSVSLPLQHPTPHVAIPPAVPPSALLPLQQPRAPSPSGDIDVISLDGSSDDGSLIVVDDEPSPEDPGKSDVSGGEEKSPALEVSDVSPPLFASPEEGEAPSPPQRQVQFMAEEAQPQPSPEPEASAASDVSSGEAK